MRGSGPAFTLITGNTWRSTPDDGRWVVSYLDAGAGMIATTKTPTHAIHNMLGFLFGLHGHMIPTGRSNHQTWPSGGGARILLLGGSSITALRTIT